MGVFIQMDNINDFDKNNQKMVWDIIKQDFSGRDAIGYSSYPLLNKTGLTCFDDIIIILDKIHGLLAFEIKDYSIKDIAKVGKNSWIIKNGITKSLSPQLQSESIFNNFIMQLNVSKDLRSNLKCKYFLVLPNISEKQWIERGYINDTSEINIIFSDEINSNMLISKVKKTSILEIEKYNDKDFYLKASKIIEQSYNQICKNCITIDTVTYHGPINISNIACKW